MSQPSELEEAGLSLRNKIIGLGEKSIQKSYYPELQRRLQELEQFRALLDESSDFFFLLQLPSGEIHDVIHATCAQLGYPRDELLHQPFAKFTSTPEQITAFFAKDVLEAGFHRSLVTEIIKKPAGIIPVEIMFSLVKFKDVNYLVAIARDITERQRNEEAIMLLNIGLEQRISERTKQLNQVIEELESFSYSISHDLRAPLRAINGYTKILLEDYEKALDTQGYDYLNRVQDATIRMSELIDGLLEVSRTNRAPIYVTQIDLCPIAGRIISEIHASQSERKIEWVIPEELFVEADLTLIRRVLENLFWNASKFTAHHATARIELGEMIKDDRRVFFIQDDGAGFDMKFVDKLFIPFQRLHHENEFTGTGIGLSIVKKIIEKHGGQIWVESGIEKGTTFFFTLK